MNAQPKEDIRMAPRDGRQDFDFLHGRWKIRNERLTRRLAGSDEWETFDAAQGCRPILDGLGNIDDYVSDWDGGYVGMALRLFDPKTKQWSIYWASDRAGILETPVTGGFKDGIGTFYGREEHGGRPVLQRFVWSEVTLSSAVWQQAWSLDEGKTWETNWIMRFSRIA